MKNWLGCERLLYSIRMDSGRSEGKRKTKKYLEKDSRERAKQSGVEELGGSQSGCTRQKVLVRQRGGLMSKLARWDMMTHDDDALWNVSEEITCNRHTLLQSRFNLLQVRSPAVPKFVFAVLFAHLLFTFWAVSFLFYTHFCGSFSTVSIW